MGDTVASFFVAVIPAWNRICASYVAKRFPGRFVHRQERADAILRAARLPKSERARTRRPYMLDDSVLGSPLA